MGDLRIKEAAAELGLSPRTLRELHAERGDRHLEKMLHREFSDLRTRGEWFRRDARLLAHIEQRKKVVGDLLGHLR